MKQSIKKACYNELLTGGFVIGLLYSIQIFVVYYLNGNQTLSWLFLMYGIAIMTYCQIYFGRRVAAIKDTAGAGYSYITALWFTIRIMILSGIVVGFASWLLQNVIAPEYGQMLQRMSIEKFSAIMPNATEEQINVARSTAASMSSVWLLITMSMLSMLLNGGLLGLITSAFIKRQPNIFEKND